MPGRKTVSWLLCALWMGVIFLMSAMPGDVSGAQSGMLTQAVLSALRFVFGSHAAAISPETAELLVRKGAHMAEYAVLFLLYRHALQESGAKRPALLAFLMSVMYAATDEYHQSFVGGRGPSYVDVMIDAAGSALAWGLWRLRAAKR